ncbi:MAG TPA: hypothetical protein VGA93_05395 [Actinomycetota bacterium]
MLKRPRSIGVATAAVSIAASLVAAAASRASAAFPGANGRIAYVSTGDHRVIFTVDATGQDPQPFIDLGSGRDAVNPAWSWDGTKVAFAGQTSPGGPFAIFVANADGTGTTQQVTTPPASDTDPAWSPNGREIAFVSVMAPGGSSPPT